MTPTHPSNRWAHRWLHRWRARERSARLRDVVLLVAVVVAAGLAVVAFRAVPHHATSSGAGGAGGTGGAGGVGLGSGGATIAPVPTTPPRGALAPGAKLTRRIDAALRATSLPTLDPPASSLSTDAWTARATKEGCLDVDPRRAGPGSPCRFTPAHGRSQGLVVVLGDDEAISYLPAVRAALGDRFTIQQLTLRSCPVWDTPTDNADGTPNTLCSAFRTAALAAVARLHPDLLVVATSYLEGYALTSGAKGQGSLDQIQAGYVRSMKALTPHARYTVVLQPPPGAGANLTTCAAKGVASCRSGYGSGYIGFSRIESAVVRGAGASEIESLSWFCDGQVCPGFVGHTPVYDDGQHVTAPYAASLAPVFEAALAAAIRSQAGH